MTHSARSRPRNALSTPFHTGSADNPVLYGHSRNYLLAHAMLASARLRDKSVCHRSTSTQCARASIQNRKQCGQKTEQQKRPRQPTTTTGPIRSAQIIKSCVRACVRIGNECASSPAVSVRRESALYSRLLCAPQ